MSIAPVLAVPPASSLPRPVLTGSPPLSPSMSHPLDPLDPSGPLDPPDPSGAVALLPLPAPATSAALPPRPPSCVSLLSQPLALCPLEPLGPVHPLVWPLGTAVPLLLASSRSSSSFGLNLPGCQPNASGASGPPRAHTKGTSRRSCFDPASSGTTSAEYHSLKAFLASTCRQHQCDLASNVARTP